MDRVVARSFAVNTLLGCEYSTPAKLGDFLLTRTRKSLGLGCYLLVANVPKEDEDPIDNLVQCLELRYVPGLPTNTQSKA